MSEIALLFTSGEKSVLRHADADDGIAITMAPKACVTISSAFDAGNIELVSVDARGGEAGTAPLCA